MDDNKSQSLEFQRDALYEEIARLNQLKSEIAEDITEIDKTITQIKNLNLVGKCIKVKYGLSVTLYKFLRLTESGKLDYQSVTYFLHETRFYAHTYNDSEFYVGEDDVEIPVEDFDSVYNAVVEFDTNLKQNLVV
jgi:hypothetical protein